MQLSALDLSYNQICPRGAESVAKLLEWDVQMAAYISIVCTYLWARFARTLPSRLLYGVA